MISPYSIPAALAFLAKIAILLISHRAELQGSRARLFRTAVGLSVALNVAEFIVLQKFSYQISFSGVVAYYAISVLVVPLLTHLAISISIDTWSQGRFVPVYVGMYGSAVALATLFIFGTPLLVTAIEDMRGYTVTALRGSFYGAYQAFLVLNFLAILLLPIYGLRNDREQSRRDQCKLWIVATTPLVILVLTIVALLHLNIRWFNITVTSPLLIALMFASIGYVVHKHPVIELDFYIPGSKGRRRKMGFYKQLSNLEANAPHCPSLQALLDDIAHVFCCPVALVTNIGAKQVSKGAPESLSSLPVSALTGIQQFVVVDDPTLPEWAHGAMVRASAAAIIPFFPCARTLSFWLICGSQFNRQVYSSLDFKRLKTLIEKLSGCLLEKTIIERTILELPIADQALALNEEHGAYPCTPQTLQTRIEELEAGFIRAALAQAKGNKAEAARLLGVRPNTLHYKLRRYQI